MGIADDLVGKVLHGLKRLQVSGFTRLDGGLFASGPNRVNGLDVDRLLNVHGPLVGDTPGMTGIWTIYRARVTLSASQAAAMNTTVKVAFDTKDYDPNNNFDTVNNRYTAPVTGYYFVSWVVNNTPGAQIGYLTAWLRKNGADLGSASGSYSATASNNWIGGSAGTHILKLTAGDFIEVFFNMQSTVGATTIIGGSTNASSDFCIAFQGV